MTKCFLTSSFLLLALTVGFAMQAEAGPIVLDGGFEIPTPSGLGYTGSLLDGWTAALGTIGIGNVSAFWAPDVPHSGNQFAYLDWSDTVNTVSQTLTTVVGQPYLISYWVADTSANSLSVSFGSQVLFNGTAPTNGVTLVSDYVNYTYTVTAASTSTILSFTGQWLALPSDYGTLLDDVSVNAVPEPATLGFTGLGCLALFALRRKQA